MPSNSELTWSWNEVGKVFSIEISIQFSVLAPRNPIGQLKFIKRNLDAEDIETDETEN